MNIRIEADYYTFAEISKSWKLAADSFNLHRAVLKGHLRPCVLVKVGLQPFDTRDGAAPHAANDDSRGWRYVAHEYQVQTGAFEADFPVVADTPGPTPGRRLWALDQPLLLTDVLQHGVVMASDLRECERRHGGTQDASTKEVGSMLALISTLLAEYCRYDPSEKDSVHALLSEKSKEHGNYVSEGTVRKFARRAVHEYPPQYLYRPPDSAGNVGA